MNAQHCIRLAITSLLVAACEHAQERDLHPEGHQHEEAELEPLAITRWTADYELFVELTRPAPGKPVRYHAHITRLADFAAVTEGTLRLRFKTADKVVAEATQQGVKRPGIFVFESPAPAAGKYELQLRYEHASKVDMFDCGTLEVSDRPASTEERPGGAITFLKESQWKIPFETAWAEQHPIAHVLEVPATVEPAASDQLTIGAPTAGRYFHAAKLVLAEGLRVRKGDVIGSIAPTVAGDDFSRLQIAVDEARLARDQVQREIDRVEPLVQQGLLPGRRLLELQNRLATESAKLNAASGRVGHVVTPGGAGTITLRSTLDGVVSQVLVSNGQPVEAGAPLVRLGGTDHLWIRSRFVAKPAADLASAEPRSVRLADGAQIELEPLAARFLSTLPVVDPRSRLATWIVDVAQAVPTDLRVGANVVLSIRFGAPHSLLAVPRSAVVEIDTRPYVFVQIDGEHFEKRSVVLGATDPPWVAVSSGVKAGERVVTRGGFDIHLASLMGTIESHRH